MKYRNVSLREANQNFFPAYRCRGGRGNFLHHKARPRGGTADTFNLPF